MLACFDDGGACGAAMRCASERLSFVVGVVAASCGATLAAAIRIFEFDKTVYSGHYKILFLMLFINTMEVNCKVKIKLIYCILKSVFCFVERRLLATLFFFVKNTIYPGQTISNT